MALLVDIISLVFTFLWIIVLADVIVSWVLDPFHPIRNFLDSIVQPMLNPIRRIVPPAGGIDFSPLVLLIGLQLARTLVLGLLQSV